jgi:hypothetical protein
VPVIIAVATSHKQKTQTKKISQSLDAKKKKNPPPPPPDPKKQNNKKISPCLVSLYIKRTRSRFSPPLSPHIKRRRREKQTQPGWGKKKLLLLVSSSYLTNN